MRQIDWVLDFLSARPPMLLSMSYTASFQREGSILVSMEKTKVCHRKGKHVFFSWAVAKLIDCDNVYVVHSCNKDKLVSKKITKPL